MADIRTEFEERIARAVARFANHAEGEGMDVGLLDGKVTLTLDGGQLTGLEFAPEPKPKAGQPRGRVGEQRTAAGSGDLPLLDKDE